MNLLMSIVMEPSYHWMWLRGGCVKLQAASRICFASPESSARWTWCLIDQDPDLPGYLLQPGALALENRVKPVFQILC